MSNNTGRNSPLLSLKTPPVVTDKHDTEGLHAFIDYLIALENLPNEVAAEEECKRLTPVFKVMEGRFKNLHARAPEAIHPVLLEKGAVTRAYMDSTRLTGSTVFSTPAIVPRSALKRIYKFKAGKKYEFPTFEYDTDHNFKTYMMGFVQSHRRDSRGKPLSSISLPLLALDDYAMKKVSPYKPQKMFSALQTMVAIANHDFYHQLTNIFANTGISYRTRKAPYEYMMKQQNKSLFHYDDDEDLIKGYEGWTRSTYAENWQSLKQGRWGQQFKKAIETYFDELGRISQQIVSDVHTKAKAPNKEEFALLRAHQVIDYFSLQACFLVGNLHSLEDPLMKYALERTRQVDPCPEDTLMIFLAAAPWETFDEVFLSMPDDDFDEIYKHLATISPIKAKAVTYTDKAKEKYEKLIKDPEKNKRAIKKARDDIRIQLVNDISAFWFNDFRKIPKKTMSEFSIYLAHFPVKLGEETMPLLEALLDPQAREVLSSYRHSGHIKRSVYDVDAPLPYEYLRKLELLAMDPKFASIHQPNYRTDEIYYRARATAVDAQIIQTIIEPRPA